MGVILGQVRGDRGRYAWSDVSNCNLVILSGRAGRGRSPLGQGVVLQVLASRYPILHQAVHTTVKAAGGHSITETQQPSGYRGEINSFFNFL